MVRNFNPLGEHIPAPMQKLGERLAAKVMSSSFVTTLSCSSEAGTFASAVMVMMRASSLF
jgi:hypothetical protein